MNWPAEQVEQAAAPEALKVPAAHGEQDARLVVAPNRPAAHAVQDEATASLYRPMAQLAHAVEPPEVNLPALHDRHED